MDAALIDTAVLEHARACLAQKKGFRLFCAVPQVLDLIGSKWAILINVSSG